jgi:hypothetical protein
MHSAVSSYFQIENTPKGIPGLKLWLRSDDAIYSNGTVSQINDKSGNGKHAVQNNPSRRPYYFLSGGIGNFPYWQGVSHSSSGRCLLAGQNGDFDFLHNGSDWTLIYIASAPTNNSSLIFGTQFAYSSDVGFSAWEYANPGITFYMGNGTSTVISKNQLIGFNSGSWNTAILTYKNSQTPALEGKLNSSIVTTANKLASTTTVSSGRKFGIGSSGTGNFSSTTKFTEIMIYDRALEQKEIEIIENYIMNRYIKSPADLPGLAAWWQADDVVMIGPNITQFNDKSGNGRHATNSFVLFTLTQSSDPQYNGKFVAITNGNSNQAYIPSSFTLNQPFTIFVVGNGSVDNWETFIDSSSGNRVIFRKNTSNNFVVFAGSSDVALANFNVKTNPSIGWCEYNAGSTKGNVNSNVEITLQNPGVNSLTQPILFVGNSGIYPMADGSKFASLLIYNRILTKAERTRVLRYLSEYYGIPVTIL